jgi:LCP family protein required for cell wall assembly
MSDEPRDKAQPEDRPYRVHRAGGDGRGSASRDGRSSAGGDGGAGPGADAREQPNRPYTVYRAGPKGLLARLRGEQETGLPRPEKPGREGGAPGQERGGGRRITPRRVAKYLALAIVAWLVLSLVLFLVSAQIESGSLPNSASTALASGGNMLTSTDTVLVIGTDQRPAGSKEPGAFAGGIRSDTIMLWRIGGGTSRRLSIPRDTMVPIPGHGTTKINAAYSFGGPALAIRTIEQFTGVKINHLIVVNLANFPKFIDALGGVDVTTGRICSDISGGAKNGGFSLFLRPGSHHLTGIQALTLARTRENKCNVASNDLTREGYQQKILNAIKSRLLSPSTFFRLPWASWAAPKAVESDMGGFTLLSLFAAAEVGGSAPTQILGTGRLPLADPQSAGGRAAVRRAVSKLMNG